jgi:hypothetical protein
MMIMQHMNMSDMGGSYLLVVHVSNVWKYCLLCIDETELVTDEVTIDFN